MWAPFWIISGIGARKASSPEVWASIEAELKLMPNFKIQNFKQNKYDVPTHVPEFGTDKEHTGLLLIDFLMLNK